MGLPCGSLSRPVAQLGRRRAYHVPPLSPCGLGRASPPVVRQLRRKSSEPPDLTMYLLVQACQHLALGLYDDGYGASPGLTIPHNPGSQPPGDAGSRGFDLAISATLHEGGGYVVPAASHPTIPRDARAGRIPRAVPRVMSLRVHDSNSGDIVSHPNDKDKLPGPPASPSCRAKPGWRPRSASSAGSAMIRNRLPPPFLSLF